MSTASLAISISFERAREFRSGPSGVHLKAAKDDLAVLIGRQIASLAVLTSRWCVWLDLSVFNPLPLPPSLRVSLEAGRTSNRGRAVPTRFPVGQGFRANDSRRHSVQAAKGRQLRRLE